MKSYRERYAGGILAVLIAGYAIFFSICSVFRYQNFLFQNFDLAIGNQILWNLMHGSMDCSIRGGHFFGDHFRPIFFAYLPLYVIFPDPKNLLVIQSIILGLGAIPVFLIARRRLGPLFALVFSFAYLLSPSLGYVNLFEFHPEAAVTPLLLFAIYFFIENNFKKFLIFILLALCCKENISFIVFMMGFWAIFKKRDLRWYLATFGLGFLWFVLSFKVIIPFFNQGQYQYFLLYGYLGKSFGGIITTFLTRPLFVLKCIFDFPNIKYLFTVFVQTGFLPLLSPLSLLPSIPPFLQVMLTHARGTPDIYSHYGAKMIPFLFAAAIFAVDRIVSLSKGSVLKWIAALYILFFSIFSNWYFGPQMHFPKKIADFKDKEKSIIKKRLADLVPKGAGVVATFDYLPILSSRKELYSFHYLYWGFDQLTGRVFKMPADVNYALIDFNDFNIFWAVYSPRGDENMRRFFDEGGWRVIAAADTVFLLKKGSGTDQKMFDISDTAMIKNSLITNLNDRIILLGYDLESSTVKSGDVLSFYIYLEQNNPMDTGQTVFVNKNYGIYFQLADREGKIVLEKKWPVCYGVYPNKKWKPAEVVKMLNAIYIPRNISAGSYSLLMGTYESKIDSFRLDKPKDEAELILKHHPVQICGVKIDS